MEHGENEVHALKKTDLDVEAGKLTLLVGPSGSGKTTLISIIATILTPDGGELFLLGQDVGLMTSNEKAHFRNQHMGIVFQSLFLIPSLTVLENVSLPLIVAGYTQEEADRKVEGVVGDGSFGPSGKFFAGIIVKRTAAARGDIQGYGQ